MTMKDDLASIQHRGRMGDSLRDRAAPATQRSQRAVSGKASIPSADDIIARLRRLSGLNHAEDHWDYEELVETVEAAITYIQEHP